MATADELDSRCDIEIVGAALAANEPQFLSAVLARVPRHIHAAEKISIYCAERRALDGWMEWTMRVDYKSKHGITIGCVQRRVGADVEFHS